MNNAAKVTIGNTTETIGDAHEVYMQGMKDILNRADSNSPQFPKEETHEEHVTKVAGGVGIVMNYTSVLAQRIEDLELELKVTQDKLARSEHMLSEAMEAINIISKNKLCKP